ncbi:STAS-like domain-containing protein [Rhodanobacter umsongensis]
MKILVKNISGPNAVASHHGDALYKQVVSGIEKDDVVELDFAGIEIFSTPFFNLGIARLLQGRTVGYLNSHVKFVNLSPVGRSTLRRVIDNAKRHYGAQAMSNPTP